MQAALRMSNEGSGTRDAGHPVVSRVARYERRSTLLVGFAAVAAPRRIADRASARTQSCHVIATDRAMRRAPLKFVRFSRNVADDSGVRGAFDRALL